MIGKYQFFILIISFKIIIGVSTAKNVGDLSTKFIQVSAGFETSFFCGISGESDSNLLHGSKIKWFYKPCGHIFNHTSCHSGNDFNWSTIPCPSGCQPTIQIKNATEYQSGLYRCTIYPYKPNDLTTIPIQLVRTYQLAVINLSVLRPDFVDNLPENLTAATGSQVVLQCRVSSRVHPTIKWLRRRLDSLYDSNFYLKHSNLKLLQYFEKTYEVLDSAGEKGLNKDTYLSKLILNGVNKMDSGFYVCVAINYRGHNIRECYLDVINPGDFIDIEREMDADGQDENMRKQLWLLFLMPVGLALLPLSIWGGCLIRKRFFESKIEFNYSTHNEYIAVRNNC